MDEFLNGLNDLITSLGNEDFDRSTALPQAQEILEQAQQLSTSYNNLNDVATNTQAEIEALRLHNQALQKANDKLFNGIDPNNPNKQNTEKPPVKSWYDLTHDD